MVFSLRSTSARVVIISLTNRPLPPLNSRHRVRKGAFVIPAMGARTTGGETTCGPTRRGDTAGAADGEADEATGVDIAPLSRTAPGARPQAHVPVIS